MIIIIITYKFPPAHGVGGRRWAKFAKYLAREGYEVYVITSKFPSGDVTWENDVQSDRIKVHLFKSRFPRFLQRPYKNRLFQKIVALINFFLYNSFFCKEGATRDLQSITSTAKDLIKKHGIKNIIVSTPPPSIAESGIILKNDLPDINLIVDYRDVYNMDPLYTYPKKFYRYKTKYNHVMTEFLINQCADHVITVSEDMTKSLKKVYKSFAYKIKTLTNGYDVDDCKIESPVIPDELSIIYCGSLSTGRINAIYKIIDAVVDLNDQFINEKLRLTVFSNFDWRRIPEKYKDFVSRKININKMVPSSLLSENIIKHRFGLIINSKEISWALPTKLFDYAIHNRKMCLISEPGYLFDYLENKNEFVASYDVQDIQKMLLKMKDDCKNQDSIVNDYSEFDLKNITSHLEAFFE